MPEMPQPRPRCFYCDALILRNNLTDDPGEVMLYAGKVACRACWTYNINHFEN